MRIDAHQHFWRYRPETHGWISEAMAVLKRDYLPRDLEPLLRGQGFDGCVAVQAAQTIEETRFLLELAERHPFVRAVVGYVDLASPDLERQLDELVRHPRFRGVRHIAQDEPDERWLARPDVVHGIGALRRHGLSYDILVYARQLPAAVELVRQLPDQPFVLDHLGKPEVRSGRLEPWRGELRRLATHGNVACKLSGLVTEADWDGWTTADVRPYLEAALEAFGPGRLMIGSDWPVCLLAGDYARVIGLATDFVASLSADEQAAILGTNARRFYGIPGGAS
ncbi:MAG: amidohydrolase family protein [Betaproteobacteria bacterium]